MVPNGIVAVRLELELPNSSVSRSAPDCTATGVIELATLKSVP